MAHAHKCQHYQTALRLLDNRKPVENNTTKTQTTFRNTQAIKTVSYADILKPNTQSCQGNQLQKLTELLFQDISIKSNLGI